MRDGEFSFLAAALVYQYIASLDTMERTAAANATRPGMGRASAPSRMFPTPVQPIPSPVTASIEASRMAAIHSNRSWPKGCSRSASFPASLTPAITTKVLSTSDAEWTASDTIAPEWATNPAANFRIVSTTLPRIVTTETRIALASPLF